jgi:hypothetical protein
MARPSQFRSGSVPIGQLASAVVQRLGASPTPGGARRSRADAIASAVVMRLQRPEAARAAAPIAAPMSANALASAVARRLRVAPTRRGPSAEGIASAVARRLAVPARRGAGTAASPNAIASAVARRLGVRGGQSLASAVAVRLRPRPPRRFPVSALASAIASRLAPLAQEGGQQQQVPAQEESAESLGVQDQEQSS